MIQTKNNLTVLALLAALALHGCGGNGAPDRSEVQARYTAASKAFNEGDHATCIEHITAALEMGGLTPDQFIDAYVRRAICRAHTGDPQGAHADLDFVADNAPDLDLIYSARSFVLHSEGKTREATSMLAKARALNRNVEEFGK